MTKKITVNISTLLLDELRKKLNNAFIKRDAFLNSVFKQEIENLSEVKMKNKKEDKKKLSKLMFYGLPSFFSEREKFDSETGKWIYSKADIHDEQKLLYFQKLYIFENISITLDDDVVEKINTTCKDKNIPRDLFINRVVYLLTINLVFHKDDSKKHEGISQYHNEDFKDFDDDHDWIDWIGRHVMHSALYSHEHNMLDVIASHANYPLQLLESQVYDGGVFDFSCFYDVMQDEILTLYEQNKKRIKEDNLKEGKKMIDQKIIEGKENKK